MVKIALLGLGTVGSGVAEVLQKNAASIEKKAGDALEIKYILTRSDRPGSPWQDRIIHDFSIIEQDPEIRIVVECMGGVGAALDYVRRALAADKHVVTSNKELVAEHGYQLMSTAREKNLNFLFEASVGGGIPILRPLTSCLAANDLTEICGIINGTTNYILTKMLREGLSYDQALRQAMDLGYAEADPTADVEGHDACRKICILAALTFGRHVYPRQVPTVGISSLTRQDTVFAQAAGYRLKLLGRAWRTEDDRVCIYVSPHLVAEDQQLAGVEDVFNGIVVKGDAIGEVLFYGRGAGKLPTASAVMGDVIDVVRHFDSRKSVDWLDGGDDFVADARQMPMQWYIRCPADKAPPLEDLRPIRAQVPGEQAFLTGPLTWDQVHQLGGEALLGCIPILSA